MTSDDIALPRRIFAEKAFADDVEYVAAARRLQPRYSQTVVCQLLTMMECIAAGVVAFLVLSNKGAIPQHGMLLPAACGVAVAAMSLAALAWGSGLRPERFASRLALLPGALLTALFVTLAARLMGADVTYTALAGATLFAAAYIAKVPTAILMLALQSAGRLMRLVGVASDDPGARRDLVASLRRRADVEIVFSGSPYALKTLCGLSRDGQLDEIVIADGEAGPIDIAPLAELPVILVRVLPDDRMLARRMHPTPYLETAGPWNGPAAVIATPPLSGWQGVAKRTLDIAGSLTALILLSPLMLLTALAIRLESPGPVLFCQERIGYRNGTFRMFKFRSMLAQHADAHGARLTERNDPRVTRVGGFIRRTSIDELPQLFNVLAGDMSLVGPRPHALAAKAGGVLYDDLIPNFHARYRMKPGITGLAQISGHRGNTKTAQSLLDRFDSDMDYAARWTPMLDIAILLRTVRHVIDGKNAF